MNSHDATHKFLEHVYRFIDFLLQQYEKEGKSYVTISIGCTGGRHRSVAVAEDLAARLRARGIAVTTGHRDIAR